MKRLLAGVVGAVLSVVATLIVILDDADDSLYVFDDDDYPVVG